MTFTLEALPARHGDCLLLHYGTAADPRTLLIDGGPSAVWGESLKPRLRELREQHRARGLDAAAPLTLELIMVSHVDDDHIGGLLALTDDQLGQRDPDALRVRTKALWHNSLGDLTADDDGVLEIASGHQNADADALIASVAQGRLLQTQAELLGWPINAPFKTLVQAPEQGGRTVRLDGTTELFVIAPRKDQIEGLRKEWVKQLRRARNRQATPAEVSAYLDTSPYNLSSIVCLAKQGRRSILLTGDARGDHILDALDAAGATIDGKLRVDILKVPHHGSIRDLDRDFFERIRADHYVISANGRDGNPETETLRLVAASRRDNKFTIHLTYSHGTGDLQQRIKSFADTSRAAGRSFKVHARQDAEPAVVIALEPRAIRRRRAVPPRP
jgi:beta-lactamase superfamily II metal-dependent hydrolase